MTQDASREAPKNCPFCGSKAFQNAYWEWHCGNTSCPIYTVKFRTLKAWNTRASTTALESSEGVDVDKLAQIIWSDPRWNELLFAFKRHDEGCTIVPSQIALFAIALAVPYLRQPQEKVSVRDCIKAAAPFGFISETQIKAILEAAGVQHVD